MKRRKTRVQFTTTVAQLTFDGINLYSKQWGVPRGRVIDLALEALRAREEELLMREAYQNLNTHYRDVLEDFTHAQSRSMPDL